MNGFAHFVLNRDMKNSAARRNSGGMQELCHKFTIHVPKYVHDCLVWFKLDKPLFNFDKDVITVCLLYIIPTGSNREHFLG